MVMAVPGHVALSAVATFTRCPAEPGINVPIDALDMKATIMSITVLGTVAYREGSSVKSESLKSSDGLRSSVIGPQCVGQSG